MLPVLTMNPNSRTKSGVLLLDKPSGLTSNTALQRARRALARVKAGHTGTLDPLASGLLPVCLGEATKFAGGLLEAEKTYEAVLEFGAATTTGDAEGEITFRACSSGNAAHVEAVLPEFVGEIQQTPPMFSAIKYRGRPLYEYARAGTEVERRARWVRIYDIQMLSIDWPQVALKIRCSKGTYIRTLAHDLGMRVGCGAHLKALRRTALGPLRIQDAISLADLEASDEVARWSRVHALDLPLAHLPAVTLSAEAARALMLGRPVRLQSMMQPTGPVRLYAQGVFLGLGEADGDSRGVKPRRLRADIPLESLAAA
jgi:tRNA pseudouridine55 synthase